MPLVQVCCHRGRLGHAIGFRREYQRHRLRHRRTRGGHPQEPLLTSAEFNPDEWVWKNVKHLRIGETSVTSQDDLKGTVISGLRRLFADPHPRYITT